MQGLGLIRKLKSAIGGERSNSTACPPVRLLVAPHRTGDDRSAEIDFLLIQNGCRIGVERQHADAHVLTPSVRIALADLKLDELRVVYPGKKRFALTKKVEVVPQSQLVNATQ